MANIIKANKLYTFGGENHEKQILLTKEEIIKELIKFPAISMKGHRDEVIEIDTEVNPPVFKWKINYLNNMDQYSLSILRDFAKNRNK